MGSCLSSPNRIPTMSSSSSSSSLKKQKKRRKNEEEKGRNGRGRGGKRVVFSDDPVSIGRWEVREEELHRLPDRMFLNGSSEVACLFSQQGKKGINQDAMLVWENFASRKDTIFCGVFDGHGPYGHMVSKKVRDALPLKLYTQWRDTVHGQNRYRNGSVPGSMNCEESTDEERGESLDADENERIPKMYLPLRRSLLEAFKLMDMELELHSSIDCFSSGTTAVAVIKQGQDLVIGNVGDSRAILGARDKDNNLVALQLTEDLKPNLPKEAARIQQCKGRVFALQEEPEVARVWLPNNDSPGLAMARAFGDFCLKDYGLISVPDISYHCLSEKDEFIVLATDGVWDVLSNQEVVDIVSSAATRGTSARALVDCAVRSWRMKFPTSKIDDCAAVCLFFNPQVSSSQGSQKEQTEQTSLCSSHEHGSQQEEVDESATSDAQTCITSPAHSPSARSAAQTCITSSAHSTLAPDGVEPKQEVSKRSKPTRSLADCVSTSEEWSALEGVTRVNSLVNLARFSSDKRSSACRKWL